MEINRDYHQLLTHSIKLGGLAICNPVDTVESVDKASLVATCHLTVSLVETATALTLGCIVYAPLRLGWRIKGIGSKMSRSSSSNAAWANPQWQDRINRNVPQSHGSQSSPIS